MKPRVYVETTVISYLAARPARDVVVAGRQQSTRDWWMTASQRFELVVSALVRQEAGVGDPDAVRARLALLDPLGSLDVGAEAQELAEQPVVKVGHSGIDTTALLFYTGGHGDGHDT